jgi:hypothetical protein
LEIVFPLTRDVGSNPTLSAIAFGQRRLVNSGGTTFAGAEGNLRGQFDVLSGRSCRLVFGGAFGVAQRSYRRVSVEALAPRNPIIQLSFSGKCVAPVTASQAAATAIHDPPRTIRNPSRPTWYEVEYQSNVHSATLPAMSHAPYGLLKRSKLPTGAA